MTSQTDEYMNTMFRLQGMPRESLVNIARLVNQDIKQKVIKDVHKLKKSKLVVELMLRHDILKKHINSNVDLKKNKPKFKIDPKTGKIDKKQNEDINKKLKKQIEEIDKQMAINQKKIDKQNKKEKKTFLTPFKSDPKPEKPKPEKPIPAPRKKKIKPVPKPRPAFSLKKKPEIKITTFNEPKNNKEVFNQTVEKIKQLNKKYHPLFDNLKNVDSKDIKKEKLKIIKEARPEIKKILNNFGSKYDIKPEIDLIKSPFKAYKNFTLVKDSAQIQQLLKMYQIDTSKFYSVVLTELEKKLFEINKFVIEKPRYERYIIVNKLILQTKNKKELNKIKTRLNKDDFGDLGKYEKILFGEIENQNKKPEIKITTFKEPKKKMNVVEIVIDILQNPLSKKRKIIIEFVEMQLEDEIDDIKERLGLEKKALSNKMLIGILTKTSFKENQNILKTSIDDLKEQLNDSLEAYSPKPQQYGDEVADFIKLIKGYKKKVPKKK